MIDHFTINKRLINGVLTKYRTTFDAFCELINNSIHANSKSVGIRIDAAELLHDSSGSGFKRIYIKDDGYGVSKSEFKVRILDIATDSKQAQGGKGIGRFAALQLGAKMEIETVAHDPLELKKYKSTLIVDTAKWNSNGKALDQIPLEVTYDEVPDSTDSYYAVTISDFHPQDIVAKDRHLRMMTCFSDRAMERSIFERYTDVVLRGTTCFTINGYSIAPEDHIIGEVEEGDSIFTDHQGVEHSLQFKYMQVKSTQARHKIFLRVPNGNVAAVAHAYDYSGDIPAENQWIVFVDSSYFNGDADVFRGLFMSGLDPDTEAVTVAIKASVDGFFSIKYAPYYDFTTKLKNDSSYPYRQEEASSSSRVSVFNQLAFYIEEKHQLLKKKSTLRNLVYSLVDRSLNMRDFDELLSKVLKVDDIVASRFNSLLTQVDLEDVVAFCDEVKDKQQFLDFLHKLNYGDLSKCVGERAQLHKIVQRHLWVFGEEYNDSPILFSDKNLRNNLEQLRENYFNYTPTEEDDNLNGDVSEELRDITDLFFFNEKLLSADQKEVMIVELKAPRVKLGQKELAQAKRYAFQVQNAGVFPDDIKYKIILIGSEIAPILRSEYGQRDAKRPTLVYRNEGAKQVEIWAIRWSDLIEENRRKLTYLGKHLETKDREVQEYWVSKFGDVPTKELFSTMESADSPKEKKRKDSRKKSA